MFVEVSSVEPEHAKFMSQRANKAAARIFFKASPDMRDERTGLIYHMWIMYVTAAKTYRTREDVVK